MSVAILPIMAGRAGGGPETYECELVAGIARLDRETRYDLLCLSESARAALATGAPNVGSRLLSGPGRVAKLTLGLFRALASDRPKLIHSAYIAPPSTFGVPQVFTLHCSSPFVHPEMFPLAIRARLLFLLRRGMASADHVICVSQDVLERAAEHFSVPPSRMSVIHNGVGSHFCAPSPDSVVAARQRHGLPERFVLAVARFEKRKNLDRILQAFRLYRDRADPDCTLAIAGDMSWERATLERRIAELHLGGAVRCLGYVPNEELPALFGAALFFAYPSLWEGFGIPVLEAMACGTPVLTSTTSSLPEVAGDAALLVDPAEVEAIADGMVRLGTDPSLRAALVSRGLVRAKSFSWERCARETLAVYRGFA